MTSIAFIGGDGAGKTTVANAVIKTAGLPMKYLYMGLSTRSSRHALPISRLVLFLKRRRYKKAVEASNGQLPEDMPASQLEYAEPRLGGWLWNAARFLNQLAEASYRQLVALSFQARGFIPVYDRHFYFDSAPVRKKYPDRSLQFFEQLFFRLIHRWYPRPTLTIFLDALPELLYQRKGEASLSYLEQQRQIYLELGQQLAHFVRIDASQPLDMVIEEAMRVIGDNNDILGHKQRDLPSREKIDQKDTEKIV